MPLLKYKGIVSYTDNNFTINKQININNNLDNHYVFYKFRIKIIV